MSDAAGSSAAASFLPTVGIAAIRVCGCKRQRDTSAREPRGELIRRAKHLDVSKIDAIDGTALQFGLSGSAKGLDKNNDRDIDTILTGAWGGTLSYGSTPTPLAPAAFFGERM